MLNTLSIATAEDPVRKKSEEGVQRSFASLVERHSQLVYRIALAVTRNPQDAEDVTQEAFLQLYRGNRWDQVEDERGYLARVAWRLAVRRRRPGNEEQELPAQLYSLAASPEESAMDREMEAWMHSAIDRLPEKLRQPLALVALGELKLVEVAKILGLPEGTVRRRIFTARQILRQKLEEQKGGSHEQR